MRTVQAVLALLIALMWVPIEAAHAATLTVADADELITAIQDANRNSGPDTIVLTLQNGIGSVEIIRESVPEEKICFGLTTLTSELLGPGHIEESFK
ncbi:MAG: hypothetical protein GYB68_10325, partial [Chloroflexi bacterium]|nr:hypothetical protein [Chloroflexota bacterium]